jgi:hypothetical protein
MKRPKRLFRNGDIRQRVVVGKRISITWEVDDIIASAMAKQSRVVALGPLIFFSTATGDAWILDVEDNFALCLMAEGKRQPATIDETRERFAIQWEGTFRIDGKVMIYNDNTGESRRILGYPTSEIITLQALARL